MAGSEAVRSVALVAVPGCLTSAVVGSAEAFALANAVALGSGSRVDVQVVTPDGAPVVGFGGREIAGDVAMESLRADAVLLPPVVGDPRDLPESQPGVVAWAREQSRRGSTVGASCTGTFLLAETGLLDGHRATTTPAFADAFRARYPEVRLRTELRVVDEGGVVTAGAMSSYLDLALSLVGRWLGPAVAVQTARTLATDPNPRPQRPYTLPRPPVPHPDEEVRRVEHFIGAHLGEALDVERLTAEVAMSPRSLARRFRAATGESLREYVQRRRVEAAMRELESTLQSFEEITARCGYEDVRSFRRLFQRLTGVSPREYRRRFGYG